MPEEGEEGPPAGGEETIIPETGLHVTYTPEWIETWNKNPTETSIHELRELSVTILFRDEILADFIYYNLMHCRSICLSTMGTAIFCTVMESLALSMTEASSSFEVLFKTFADHMKRHQDAGYFTAEEAKLMVDYAMGTFFKHFTLYRMCLDFVQKPARRFMCEVALEEPSFPPPVLVGAENISEKARQEAAAADLPAESAGGEAKGGEAEEVVYDGNELSPEKKKILDMKIAESEGRIRNKLGDLLERTTKG
ncbi:unnamed protein product [Amoebophrya sp. A25]|nr:unnamed protein product [Amoebophrya sp. A25]|eukprot:GSA25T00018791001.1